MEEQSLARLNSWAIKTNITNIWVAFENRKILLCYIFIENILIDLNDEN